MTKVVLITGATGGLGRALVAQFARPGYSLKLVARSQVALEALKADFEDACDALDVLALDFLDLEAMSALVQWAGPVDIVIHNAGYGLFQGADRFTEADIKDIFQVNVLFPLGVTSQMLPSIYQKGLGSIVFIASQASKLVTPKSSLYSATKFALRGYANGLRLEAKKKGIHVMTVNPGPVATPFFDRADQSGDYKKAVSGMLLDPDKLAQAIYLGILKKKREVNRPYWMEAGAKLSALFPGLADKAIARFGDKK